MPENEPKLTRRQFLTYLRDGFLVTGGVELLNTAIPLIRRGEQLNKQQIRFNEIDTALANNEKLEVKYFSREIIDTTTRIIPDHFDEEHIERIIGSFASIAFGGMYLNNHTELMNRLVGATTFFLGKVIDFTSTAAVINYASDPRFNRYGFDVYFHEANPLFPSNPSDKNSFTVIMTLSLIISLIGGFYVPVFGRWYIGAAPFVARNNFDIATILGISLSLGDEVKEMLQKGRSQDEIKDYLVHIQESKK